MKKNLIVLVMVSVASLGELSTANAQVVSKNTSMEYQTNATKAKNSMNEFEAISPRALKNFAHAYKNVSGESWTKAKSGFAAQFTLNGIRTTILYDSRGYWVGSIKYYNEEKMLHEVRHIVKSTYYDYNIIYAQEVETVDTKGIPTYIICLEDTTNIKMVRICENEMSIWKEFRKAN